jgi:hypothetical protein
MTEHEEFFEWGTHEVREVPGLGTVNTPGLYYSHRMIAGVFTADLRKIRDRLPSPQLHPVRWGRDRAAVMVMGTFNTCVSNPSHDSAVAFGQTAALALVTKGSHDAPPYVPLMGLPVPERFHYGMFTLYMGETARWPIELGRRAYGTHKFLADMRYEERDGVDRVVLSDRGQHVWTLEVRTSGKPERFDDVTPIYSDLDGQLLVAQMRSGGVQVGGRGGGCASLRLGDHPVALDLQELGFDAEAMASMFQPYRIGVLDVPTGIGPAEAKHHRYEGSDAQSASMILSHAPGLDLEMPFKLPLVAVP